MQRGRVPCQDTHRKVTPTLQALAPPCSMRALCDMPPQLAAMVDALTTKESNGGVVSSGVKRMFTVPSDWDVNPCTRTVQMQEPAHAAGTTKPARATECTKELEPPAVRLTGVGPVTDVPAASVL